MNLGICGRYIILIILQKCVGGVCWLLQKLMWIRKKKEEEHLVITVKGIYSIQRSMEWISFIFRHEQSFNLHLTINHSQNNQITK